MIWNREFLRTLVREKIGEHKFVIVSNREPYIHSFADDGRIICKTPASGMTSALDPVISACGGIWVAAGMGDADRASADGSGHILVPPGNPAYTLRRVWLTKEEIEGFYYSYSNEGLWPLCHIVHVRPTFREKDFRIYESVNRKFADAVLEEIGSDTGFVFIQDYHFALLPKMLKESRPDLVVAQFWHIPWPNPEAFRVCPEAEEILWGLLGNDIIGFHIRYHCMNFLDSLDKFLEVRIDRERLSVFKEGRETIVRPFPISIDFDRIERLSSRPESEAKKLLVRNDFRIKGRRLAIGIDRLDYTKGIVERLQAVDRLLEKYPEYIENFVFIQLGPLSRIHLPKYKEYNDQIYHTMVEINEKWARNGWQPIILHKVHLELEEIVNYYKAADLCIVSSIHDGMNLVAKEFIASRIDDSGSLVLSQFTGSSRELENAVLVNPMAIDKFADAIKQALEMDETEKSERMKKMREIVRNNNVFRWAGKIVNEMKKLM